MSAVLDGLSSTILVIEDAGRPNNNGGSYDVTAPGKLLGLNGVAPASTYYDATQLATTTNTTPYVAGAGGKFGVPGRWADPDSGSGVSGPSNQTLTFINQNSQQQGGTAVTGGTATNCLWSINNCGPNDEPYSEHSGGCHALLGDGSVRFLSDQINFNVLRRLLNPKDKESLGSGEF